MAPLTMTVDAAQALSLGKWMITAGHQLVTEALSRGHRTPAANTDPQPLPPIRAYATTSDKRTHRREYERNYKRQKRAEAKARQLSLDVDVVHPVSTSTQVDKVDVSTVDKVDSRAAGFSSSSLTAEDDTTKTDSLPVTEEARPLAVDKVDKVDKPPVRTPIRITPLGERLVALFAAHRGGHAYVPEWKDELALGDLLSPRYANGNEAEIERRWVLGLNAAFPRVSTWRDLKTHWNAHAAAPKSAPAKPALASVDVAPTSDARCAVHGCGATNVARVGAGEGTPLCYAAHLRQAREAGVDWRTPPEQVIAMARGGHEPLPASLMRLF